MSDKIICHLSSGTAGTRLMINLGSGAYRFQLIFPNVNSGHKQKGITLAEAFKTVFLEKAKNIGDEKKPYFVVTLFSDDEIDQFSNKYFSPSR